MHIMIKATSHDGKDKLPDIATVHSLEGKLHWMPYTDYPFYFEYNNNSGKALRSSAVKEITTVNNQIRFRTKNTEYWFEEMEG